MTPERRRRAVCALTERFKVSEHRARGVVDQPRSTQRCPPRAPRPDEAELRRRLRQIAKTHPRWGWKVAYEILRREGWTINKKRTQRLSRHEGLRRPQRCTKRRRIRPDSAIRNQAEYPNNVRAIDFQFDETSDYRRLKMRHIVDEFTREALAIQVDRSITADRLIDVIERLVVMHAVPEHLRMDNGPELLAWALRDWCRFTGTRTIYIEPGSPWESPFVEPSNGWAPDELLNIEEFATLTEARVIVEAWRMEDGGWRMEDGVQHILAPPVVGGLTPVEFRRRWSEQHVTACS